MKEKEKKEKEKEKAKRVCEPARGKAFGAESGFTGLSGAYRLRTL